MFDYLLSKLGKEQNWGNDKYQFGKCFQRMTKSLQRMRLL